MDPRSRSLVRLVGDTVSHTATLVRQEIAVARAEAIEKVVQLATGSGLLVGAAFVLLPALTLLLIAFANLLIEWGLRGSAAYAVAAGLAIALSAALGVAGLSRVKPDKLRMSVTSDELERDRKALGQTL